MHSLARGIAPANLHRYKMTRKKTAQKKKLAKQVKVGENEHAWHFRVLA